MDTVGTVKLDSWIGAEPREVYHLLTDPSRFLSWFNAQRELDRAVPLTARNSVLYHRTLTDRRVVVAVSSDTRPQFVSVLDFSLSPIDGGTWIQMTSNLVVDRER